MQRGFSLREMTDEKDESNNGTQLKVRCVAGLLTGRGGCAKLASKNAKDNRNKDRRMAKNAIKIVVSVKSHNCDFESFSRENDGLNNGTRQGV